MDELNNYANSTSKLRRTVDKRAFCVVRGLYKTDRNFPGYYLAVSIYGPSYLPFKVALGYHYLIPETVYQLMYATFEKQKQCRH